MPRMRLRSALFGIPARPVEPFIEVAELHGNSYWNLGEGHLYGVQASAISPAQSLPRIGEHAGSGKVSRPRTPTTLPELQNN